MHSPTPMPLSKRANFTLTLHLLLDHAASTGSLIDAVLTECQVPEGERASIAPRVLRRFVEAELAKYPMPEGECASSARRVVRRAPFSPVHRMRAERFADELEKLAVIAWYEDRTRVDAATTDALTSELTRALETVERPSMPKPVAEQLLATARRVLGSRLADDTTDALREAFVRLLEADLWRGPGNEAFVVEGLLSHLETEGRLLLGPSRSGGC